MKHNCDCSGYATVNDVLCTDGRVISRDAFKDCDGATVPFVWQHGHDSVKNVIGHAVLENRRNGVYTYASFNDTEEGQHAKRSVEHGDLTAFSIYANQLKHSGNNVIHGVIREVSLVIGGANPRALIQTVGVSHGSDGGEEAIIYFDQPLAHGDEALQHADSEKSDDNVSVKDEWDKMTDAQHKVCYFMMAKAVENAAKKNNSEDKEEDSDMKHNVFSDGSDAYMGTELSHSQIDTIFKDGKRLGSLKESVLEHSAEYGIEDIDYLFPDARTLTNTPEFIKRETDWVAGVMSETKHTPFSRIKSIFADITEDAARAKGYIKGKRKKEEVFSLLKRTTTPTTVYKKQKLDRDDAIDINSFDVVAWLKSEMRMMLEEEIARAILIGDGRLASDDDHIPETNIRPVFNDDDLFTVKYDVTPGATDADTAKEIIRASIKSRKQYKGSGNPTFYTTEDWVTEMLLLEDGFGHALYKTEAELATKLRVKKIVTVPVMEGLKDADGNDVYGIIVNLADYVIGADKGGQTAFFDDFDINYNQMLYLYECRMSGALTKPYSAITLRKAAA